MKYYIHVREEARKPTYEWGSTDDLRQAVEIGKALIDVRGMRSFKIIDENGDKIDVELVSDPKAKSTFLTKDDRLRTETSWSRCKCGEPALKNESLCRKCQRELRSENSNSVDLGWGNRINV